MRQMRQFLWRKAWVPCREILLPPEQSGWPSHNSPKRGTPRAQFEDSRDMRLTLVCLKVGTDGGVGHDHEAALESLKVFAHGHARFSRITLLQSFEDFAVLRVGKFASAWHFLALHHHLAQKLSNRAQQLGQNLILRGVGNGDVELHVQRQKRLLSLAERFLHGLNQGRDLLKV